MPNFDSHGRDIGDATAIITDAVGNIPVVMPGDEVGRADAIAKIRAAMGKSVPAKPEPPVATQAEPSSDTLIAEQDEQPVISTLDDASTVSKRSTKLEELDLDEIILDFDGEELALSKEDLKKGAGLYKANNQKSEELARERKALEAEKAALAAKAGDEVRVLNDELAKRQNRTSQLDELLEYAYDNKYAALKFPDGKVSQVADLEREHKANTLAIARLQKQAQAKEKEVQESRENFIRQQREILMQKDPTITKRLDDIASYLKRGGFEDHHADTLINADARLVLLLDKARKYDDALNATPEKKKASQTKVISKPNRSENRGAADGHYVQLQKDLSSAAPGSSQYREALKALRMAERAR